jgi:hypothetical protein
VTVALPDEPAFRDLLTDQIEAALDAAVANDLIGQQDLADWWRWRAEDLGRYLADSDDPPAGADPAPTIGGSLSDHPGLPAA